MKVTVLVALILGFWHLIKGEFMAGMMRLNARKSGILRLYIWI